MRAAAWIEERDDESTTLIAIERDTERAVGLVILFEIPNEEVDDGVDIRLGYLLAERDWGRGLATELVAGLVAWCRSSGRVRSIAGGVEIDNPASAQVMVKNSFAPTGQRQEGEETYQLRFTRTGLDTS